jgi:hypothetical protein
LAPPSSALIADEMSVGVGDVLTLLWIWVSRMELQFEWDHVAAFVR